MTDHSRFSLVPLAVRNPGTCWVSKSPTGPMIDTGVEVQFAERGRIYLTVDVVREMAEVAGLFDELRTDSIADAETSYQSGFEAGQKVDLHGNLDRVVSELDRIADLLRNPVVLVADPVEDVVSAESKPKRTSSSPR